MVKEEKINNIYDSIIEGNDLTTKYLKEIGISSNDITELIKNNILIRISR